MEYNEPIDDWMARQPRMTDREVAEELYKYLPAVIVPKDSRPQGIKVALLPGAPGSGEPTD